MWLVIAAVLIAWPGIASAKGPVPTAVEPQGPFVVDEPQTVLVPFAWPRAPVVDGESPGSTAPPSPFELSAFEVYGDDPLWDLIAVRGGDASGASLDDPLVLPLTHIDDFTYSATFTPPSPGAWRLLMAYQDDSGEWIAWRSGADAAPAVTDVVVMVEEARTAATDVASASGETTGPPTSALLGIGAAAACLGALLLVVRRGRNADSAPNDAALDPVAADS